MDRSANSLTISEKRYAALIKKDENNIKIWLPTKEDFIRFDFDTLAEDINIKIEIPELELILNGFRLGDMVDKYKGRLVYKIRWDLKIDKKRIQIKSFIINKDLLGEIFIKLEKYASFI